jgi:dTDP-4-amino-4,6-dideoxygalactose transaminase
MCPILIPYHKSYISGNELEYISRAVDDKDLRGDGFFSKACQTWLEANLSLHKVFLTPSCTSALELSALLVNVTHGDEILLPSFTFPSTANAFLLRGAKLTFIDIRSDTLNLDENLLEEKITKKTKVICPMHYSGVACEMDFIMSLAKKYGLQVIEDAAHAIFSLYKGRSLGGIGHLGTFSFHETKNISCGEGGAILLNSSELVERAEIIREKGTNRSKYFRGEIDKYSWVDIGSSYLPSELVASYLYAKLEKSLELQKKRMQIWNRYYKSLEGLEYRGVLRRPIIPDHCTHNGHIFYLLLDSEIKRNAMIDFFRSRKIGAVFHYFPLHLSTMGKELGYKSGDLPVTENIHARLIRLPIYHTLTECEFNIIIESCHDFFQVQRNSQHIPSK